MQRCAWTRCGESQLHITSGMLRQDRTLLMYLCVIDFLEGQLEQLRADLHSSRRQTSLLNVVGLIFSAVVRGRITYSSLVGS
jgi:hypothetical protein